MPPDLVLVVDDSPSVRELIRVNLELEGYEVRTACDGAEALAEVAARPPSLVTLDWVMPRLDGIATATALKSDPATRAIPVVMVTARAQEADRRRGQEAGVDAYLTKPFDPALLVTTVRSLLAPR